MGKSQRMLWFAHPQEGGDCGRVLSASMRIVGLVVAVVLFAGGGFLALAGMGYIGSSSGTSQAWATIGSLLAALGVALVISILGNRNR